MQGFQLTVLSGNVLFQISKNVIADFVTCVNLSVYFAE